MYSQIFQKFIRSHVAAMLFVISGYISQLVVKIGVCIGTAIVSAIEITGAAYTFYIRACRVACVMCAENNIRINILRLFGWWNKMVR